MSALTSFASRALVAAAKRRPALSSVASVAIGYGRSLRPSGTGFSRPQHTIHSGGHR